MENFFYFSVQNERKKETNKLFSDCRILYCVCVNWHSLKLICCSSTWILNKSDGNQFNIYLQFIRSMQQNNRLRTCCLPKTLFSVAKQMIIYCVWVDTSFSVRGLELEIVIPKHIHGMGLIDSRAPHTHKHMCVLRQNVINSLATGSTVSEHGGPNTPKSSL